MKENIEKLKAIIKYSINSNELYRFMIADPQEFLGVYSNGIVEVSDDTGEEIDPEDRPFARVACPGIDSIPIEPICDGWAKYDEEYKKFIVIDTCDDFDIGIGEALTKKECIKVFCYHMAGACNALDELKDKLIRSLKGYLKNV